MLLLNLLSAFLHKECGVACVRGMGHTPLACGRHPGKLESSLPNSLTSLKAARGSSGSSGGGLLDCIDGGG